MDSVELSKTQEARIQQMFDLFRDGVLGTKEFRNWLAKVDSTFKEVRDPDIDNEIDALARKRQMLLHQNEEESQLDRKGDSAL